MSLTESRLAVNNYRIAVYILHDHYYLSVSMDVAQVEVKWMKRDSAPHRPATARSPTIADARLAPAPFPIWPKTARLPGRRRG